MKLFITIPLLLFFTGFLISDAYAYLDPATGSVFIQAIIAAFVGIGITLKIYWYKLKEKISRTPKSNE